MPSFVVTDSTCTCQAITSERYKALLSLDIPIQSTMENAGDEIAPASETLRPAVRRALQQLLDNKFPQQTYTYEVLSSTEKGENYIGVLYRIIVKLEGVAPHEERTFSLILKVPPQNPIQRKLFFARPCFLRESLAYDEFLPLTVQFQREKGVEVEACGFHHYPLCYRTISVEYDEAIFLEDLHLRDFHLFDRFAEFDSAHVALIMRAYAKLHAISFAIKDQQPERLAKFTEVVDIFAQRKDDPQLNAYFEGLKENAVACLDVDKDAGYLQKLQKYFETPFFDLMTDLIDGKQYEPYAVVCHGDCWCNNIMFRDEDNKPVEVCLIDWQIMRYASPLCDLMYFIFTCTTKEFRQAHYAEMLDIYYETLAAHIARLGSDPSNIYPRSVFDAETKRRSVIGLLFAAMVLPIITTKAEDVPNLAEFSELIESGAMDDMNAASMLGESNKSTYKKRMRDVIVDSIDYGYI